MDKQEALHYFWSSFEWAARDEITVPDDAMTRFDGHYITYSVATAFLDEPVALSASLWQRSSSWTEIAQKAEEIGETIGRGGLTIPCDGGYVWIYRGRPFSQRMADDDDTIRRIYINIWAEFITAD